MAQTGCPRRARSRASRPARVVLPLPPLPARAIFMGRLLSRVPVYAVRGVAGPLALAVRVRALVVAGPRQVCELVREAPAPFANACGCQGVARRTPRAPPFGRLREARGGEPLQ